MLEISKYFLDINSKTFLHNACDLCNECYVHPLVHTKSRPVQTEAELVFNIIIITFIVQLWLYVEYVMQCDTYKFMHIYNSVNWWITQQSPIMNHKHRIRKYSTCSWALGIFGCFVWMVKTVKISITFPVCIRKASSIGTTKLIWLAGFVF